MDWRREVDKELAHAEQARSHGNEGRARVCARRAAGILAREYFSRLGGVPRTSSALELLRRLQADPALPASAGTLVRHLTQQVDNEFHLPHNVDLLGDVRQLRQLLFTE